MRGPGNEVPHLLQTPMTTLPFSTAANALINGREFGAGIVSGFAAHRLQSVDQRFSASRRCIELCALAK
jgi:hypothetical protein